VTDALALEGLELLARTEGVIPALESAHAVAAAAQLAPRLGRGALLVINVSGRGDKDMNTVAAARGVTA
jgi:tryptophan synthase beta chain